MLVTNKIQEENELSLLYIDNKKELTDKKKNRDLYIVATFKVCLLNNTFYNNSIFLVINPSPKRKQPRRRSEEYCYNNHDYDDVIVAVDLISATPDLQLLFSAPNSKLHIPMISSVQKLSTHT